MYMQRFTVEPTDTPRGFPIDMLRYDHCWPSSQDDSCRISIYECHQCDPKNLPDMSPVELVRAVSLKADLPSQRWASFGWKVDNVHTVRV